MTNVFSMQVSHRILHMRVRDDYISSDAIFASEYIARKVGENLCGGNTIPLEVNALHLPLLVLAEVVLCMHAISDPQSLTPE